MKLVVIDSRGACAVPVMHDSPGVVQVGKGTREGGRGMGRGHLLQLNFIVLGDNG